MTAEISQEEENFSAPGMHKTEAVLKCKKCKRIMERKDRCLCRPWLCHHCCECGQDCDLCGCSHKK